jgi:hypothetical protein
MKKRNGRGTETSNRKDFNQPKIRDESRNKILCKFVPPVCRTGFCIFFHSVTGVRVAPVLAFVEKLT